MSLRPDLVECWVFRETPGSRGVEILLIRRAAHRIFPGLWQCVTGGIEPGERVPDAALREVQEETGLAGAAIEAVYDLDQVAPFYDEGTDGVVVSAIFAVRVRGDAVPVLSHEHDAMRWVPAADVPAAVVWPSYAESVRRVSEVLADPVRERWFRLDAEGHRIARRPTA
jgi:8-oxo-dGTP pyrophosphatase MutT (NUDIX family)